MFYSKWWIYTDIYLKALRRRDTKRYLNQVRAGVKPLFIHINKTAGSSIARSLNITEIHFTLREYEALYKKQFGEELPLDTDIWTSIRNPFDKVSSEYYYRIKGNQNKMATHPITFEDWVVKAYDEKDPFYRDREIMFNTQCNWIDSDKAYDINFIRFEDLNEGYKKVAAKYNGAPLVWKKKSQNKNYKETFTEKTIHIIGREFKDDLDRFNYSYE